MSIVLSPKTAIAWPDYAFIVFILAVCVAISLFFNLKRNYPSSIGSARLEEFLLAGRNLAILPAALSIAATTISPISLTAITGDMYLNGIYYTYSYFGICFSMIYMVFISVKMYRKTNYIGISIFQLLHMALILYLPALSLTTLTPFNTFITTLVLGFVCTVYSSIGGLRTVVWTDAIQCLLIMVAMLMLIFQGLIKIGNLSDIWSLSVENGYLTSISWSEVGTARSSIWAFVIMGPVLSVDYFLINQAVIQRVLAVKSNIAAINSVILAAVIVLFVGLTTTAIGAILYILYGQCNPLRLKTYTGVKTIDQVFVYAIGDLYTNYPILKGVAISGIISASLSTFSSYINAFAALALEDFLKPLFPRLTENESASVKICVGLSFAFGLLATVASLLIPFIGEAVKVLSLINGLFRGPLSGITVLLLFYKKLTKAACLSALAIVITTMTWMSIGNSLYVNKSKYTTLAHSTEKCAVQYGDAMSNSTSQVFVEVESVFTPLYEISYFWYGTIGFASSLVLAVVISEISIVLFGRKSYTQVETTVTTTNGHPEDTVELTNTNNLHIFPLSQ